MDIELKPELRESVALLIRETLCIPDTKYMAIVGMKVTTNSMPGYDIQATISVRNHISEKAVWTYVSFAIGTLP